MKILFCILLSCILTTPVFSQQTSLIDSNSVAQYDIFSLNTGGKFHLKLSGFSVQSPMNLKWEVSGLGKGLFQISAKALETGTVLYMDAPEPNETTKLKDDRTIGIVSKNVFKSLAQNQPFEFLGKTFVPQTDTTHYSIKNAKVQLLYAVTKNGKSAVWILNDSVYPLLFKTKNNPMGLDFSLVDLKN